MRIMILCTVLLLGSMLFLPGVWVRRAIAATEEQIPVVKIQPDSIVYSFAYKRMVVDLSLVPAADRDWLARTFWCADDSGGQWKSVRVVSRDSTEHAAVISQLATLGISPSAVDIQLTAQQKADVIASQLSSKAQIVRYLGICSRLREDNPTWTDETVRSVAKGGL
jgi:hypothetical protein